MIRECLECIVVMLQYPGAAIEVRNHRQVLTNLRCLIQFSSQGNAQDSCQSKKKKKHQIVIIKILGMYVISSKSYIVEALLPNVVLSCAK